MKLWYKDCVDSTLINTNLNRSNENSCQKESHPTIDVSKNLDASFKEVFQDGNVSKNLNANFKEVYKDGNEEFFELFVRNEDIDSLNSSDSASDM